MITLFISLTFPAISFHGQVVYSIFIIMSNKGPSWLVTFSIVIKREKIRMQGSLDGEREEEKGREKRRKRNLQCSPMLIFREVL